VTASDEPGRLAPMLTRQRKAAIGYATYVVGTKVAKRMVRRKARSVVNTALRHGNGMPTARGVRLPLLGALGALVAGALFLVRRRGAHEDA